MFPSDPKQVLINRIILVVILFCFYGFVYAIFNSANASELLVCTPEEIQWYEERGWTTEDCAEDKNITTDEDYQRAVEKHFQEMNHDQ